MIVLLVMTDGRRECITETIASARQQLLGPITDRLIVDDSADTAYGDWLARTFSEFRVMHHHSGERQGFGGAISMAWEYLARSADLPDAEQFVFHLEDDFTFNRPVDLATMAHTLALHPHLVQLALRRQPWNDAERDAGGIIEQHPDDYVERSNGSLTSWLEHRRFFTTNPSLYRRALCARGWPDGKNTEGRFGIELFRDPNARCGFWGSRDSGEAVTHIGRERVGHGY